MKTMTKTTMMSKEVPVAVVPTPTTKMKMMMETIMKKKTMITITGEMYMRAGMTKTNNMEADARAGVVHHPGGDLLLCREKK